MMPDRDQIKGQWNEVKGRLKEHWGQLTDDDLTRAEGSADKLVGVVQQKTGATRLEVERFLDDLLNNRVDQARDALQHYGEAAGQVAGDAAEYARQQGRRLAASSTDYTHRFVDTIRARPGESLAIAFGVGLLAGAVLFFGNKKS
jgi:uncharacterized protein YjbJ (UPF0337 family)